MNIREKATKAEKTELPLDLSAPTHAHDSDGPTPEQARRIMVNGLADFIERMPPETAAEAVEAALVPPEVAIDRFIAKAKARGDKFSPGTAGAVLVGTAQDGDVDDDPLAQTITLAGIASDDAPEPEAAESGDREQYWNVPPQAEIIIARTNEDEIEIEQKSPLGDSEDVRIHVAISNAVRLARSILFAAGFKGILIATTDGGSGYSDVEDGAEAWQFERGKA